MAALLVMVNGLPGAGKTTLAVRLAAALDAPLISKDAVKEALSAAVPAAPSVSLGRAAMDAAWRLASDIPGTVVLESWWFRPRDLSYVCANVRRCGDPLVVEVWCDPPAEVARSRYVSRRRHPIHEDAKRLADSWADWATRAAPLGIGRVVRVDTSIEVDIDALVQELGVRPSG